MAKSPKRPSKTTPAAAKKPTSRGKTTTAKSSKDIAVDTAEIYVVFGTVTYAGATPAVGVTVIAYDKDESREDRLGQATTDARGTYKIPYRAADFRRSAKERGGADVIVRVYNEKNEVLFASKSKNNAPAEYQLNIQLPVPQYMVRGSVRDANGKPLPNFIVRVFERDLRIPQLLGTTHTGVNGDYRIEYRLEDFELGDLPSRRAPWLIADVRETAGGEVLARQEIQRADRDQVVSFSLSNVGTVFEWQRISEAVAPLLKGQVKAHIEDGTHVSPSIISRDLAPWELTPEDVDFIVRDAELDRGAVEAWVTSSQMVREAESKLMDDDVTHQDVIRESGWPFFYAMARQGQVRNLDALLRESVARVRQTVGAAQSAHQIPSLTEKHVELLLDVLQLLQRLLQLDPDQSADNTFARVLADAPLPLPTAVALDALSIFHEKGFDDPDALLQLAERHPEADAPIKTFVRRVRVHQLTSGHEGLSRALHARLEGVSDSIAPLATMRASEWIGLAEEAGVSPGLTLRTQTFLETQHPLTALQAKISTGEFQLPGVSGSELATLLKEQPAIAESILQGTKRIKDIANGQETPAAHKALREIGRFMRTGVSMELGAELMKGGISSPGAAVRFGRAYIREQLQAFPQSATQEVIDGFFDTVEPWVNGGNGLTADIVIDRAYPKWMFEEVPLALPDPVRENLPTLPGLFGDLDECICTPCESMLGQPAYLVDLLNLLGKNNLHWLLKQRRPRIFTLPLSYENSDLNNPIQHINIVLEVLEEAVGGTNPYDKTALAAYPWGLPFNRPYAETKAYLAKLRVSRFDLLLLRSSQQANEIAAETLELSFPPNWAISEWRLVTEKRTGVDLWQAYGLASFGGSSFPLDDPASGEDLSSKSREEVLTRVSVLIDITGLELDELEQAFKTEFVSGFQGGLTLTNRDQCKTSEMRLVIESEEGEPPLLEGCLDRLHRFARLRAKLPGWSIPQLGDAIKACDGVETEQTEPQDRERVLVRLAIIKRLHGEYGMPLEFPHDRTISEGSLRKMLGLSALQFALLTTLTGIDPTAVTTQPLNWAALEEFCKAVKRIHENGLSVEQVAQALLTRDQLQSSRLFGELPPTIKTDKQIEELLEKVQHRLRSVAAIRPGRTLESQAAEALSEIYEAVTVDKLVKALRDAGAAHPIAPTTASLNELVGALSDTTTASHILGEWSPLMTDVEARDLLTVITTTQPSNLDANTRFEHLLNAIASRRRERELIAVIAEQCGLAASEVTLLLGARLLLDDTTPAATEFLSANFWDDIPATHTTPPRVPSVTVTDVPRLHTWMDRLYRLITLSAALQVDSELMLLADRVTVGNATGINWRDLLATPPATGRSAWANANWQALLDLVWLQQPDQLSRPALSELLNRLEARGTNSVQEQTLRPLATRLGITETQTLGIAAQAVGSLNAQTLRNPAQVRRAFELLLLARHLGASSTQLTHLANLGDIVQTATTAKALLEARIGGQENKEAWQAINDKLRQQRRDALVAYLVGNVRLAARQYKRFNTANDLYEYYLIDPQMEPCFETTRVLDATTATQLFVQRLLFGLEAGQVAIKELKDRWPWMRNYRVWEANRKVFLFPENWLFPELRDDKSSSFKQLESALGQGELTAGLANQAFGQFLDDVAQMGQVQVLGIYEDIALLDTGAIDLDSNGLPRFRTLYVIGRSVNPPYAYFWRHSVDFGSPYMEWLPWQRIELDIQGDHVLPFVMNRQVFVIWPLMNRSEPDANGESTLEIKFNWSRHDGVRWHQPKTSRDEMALARAERFDERQGVHLEGFVIKQQQEDGETRHDVAVLNVFTKSKYALESSIPTPRKVIPPAETFSSFAARNLYNKITKKHRSNGSYIGITVIPTQADPPAVPGSSAELVIIWTCWIKVKQYHSDLQPKYLKLAPSPKRQVVLDATGVPFAPCRLGTVGRFLCVNTFYAQNGNVVEKAVSGSLPTGNWQVEATFNGSRVAVQLSSDSIETPIVAVGKSTAATLVFEIDASAYTIAELGLEDLVPSQFERRGSFEIGADEVLRSSPHQIQLIAPTGTECRMNGFIELPGLGASAFSTKLPPSSSAAAFQVLGASAPGLLYEGIPAISARQGERGVDAEFCPRIWYYREGQSSAYIDVAHGLLGRTTKFCLYPASFSEAVNYCVNWRNSNAIVAAENQGGLFGAHLLSLQIAGMDRGTIRLEGAGSGINKAEQRKLSFDTQFPYACYNWEVFFHAPLLIADQLSKQHKFEEAERWLRFVFDPTNTESGDNAKRFLKFRVFNELNLNQQVIDDLTVLAQAASGLATNPDVVEKVKKLITRWSDAPFRPFLIARRRHIAFLWRTLFAYLDNLLAWADSLYRRDTIESINEATMLYVLAERILGRRPKLHRGRSNREALSYEGMNAKWDEFANYWIDVGTGSLKRPMQLVFKDRDWKKHPNPDGMLYFCMPFNDKILSYWNIVDARLSNIRNCRNIEGGQRKLPLMDAPINPELLVRATAAGLNLGDVIAGLYAPPPHYRYSILSSRAAELANECKSLGAAMLSAIEKRDAEYLAQLRSSNEISLLKLVRDVRVLQIDEADRNIEALRASRKTISSRYAQYQRLLGKTVANAPEEGKTAGEESILGRADGSISQTSNLGLITEEHSQIVSMGVARNWSDASSVSRVVASALHLTASGIFALPGSALLKVGEAADSLAKVSSTLGEAFGAISQIHQNESSHHSLMAGHIRRRDEWAFQSNQALKELQQIDKQILANQIRIDITKKELDNHLEQIEQAKAVDEVMRSKFSNVQLYEWMKTELSRLYFTAYRMAVDMARRAERAASRELGVKPLDIVRNDYWDSLRDGLLAGERLHQDLKRLEIAYLDQNRREYELTKHISLRRLNPEALVQLRAKAAGCTCKFDIPEWLFDLDAPGHYLRRIKSVSVSIPSVTGPFTSVNCKLTLLKSAVRHESSLEDNNRYLRLDSGDDDRFIDYFGATEAIVTSTGSADSGMFEMQLRDERFLPFEGGGVISTWRLELPAEYPQFDYSTISDVVLTIRYTAREGGDLLRDAATASIAELLNPPSSSTNESLLFPIVLSSRSDFPTEWARAKANHSANLDIPIARALLPYWMEAAWFGSGNNMKQLQVLNVSIADLSISPQSPPSMSDFVGVSPPATGNVWSLGMVPNETADRFVLLSVGVPVS